MADNSPEAIAVMMFNSHLLSHQAASQQQDCLEKQKLPLITPSVKQDIDGEDWVIFTE